MMYYSKNYDSPLGELTLVSNGENLNGLWMTGQKYYCQTVSGKMQPDENQPVFRMVTAWLDQYFAGRQPGISELPLAPEGGEFRQAVWKILCKIPYGQVTTYGEIAKKIACMQNKPTMSAQAVGGAVGHNPISIIIPCHRVVGTNGSLTGYAGGVDKKIKLLELEGVDLSRFTIPRKGTAL